MSKDTVRLNFDFSKEQYPYLKFLCTKRGISMRQFITELVIKEIEQTEDLELAKLSDERAKTRADDDLIDWDEAQKLAGW